MNALGWTDALSVRHKQIDADHKRLLEAINQLMRAAESGHGKEVCDREFDRLIAATWEHFTLEESLMHAHQTPDTAQHKREHAKLIDELIILKSHYDAGTMTIPENMQAALYRWLSQHIIECDKPLADHIRAAIEAAKLAAPPGQAGRVFGVPHACGSGRQS